MNKFACKNCHLEFDGDDIQQCPRCSSANVFRKHEKKENVAVHSPTAATPPVPRKFTYAPVTDTKESWMKFHNTGEAQACPGCGSKEFDFNWKKREKVCKKCGEILNLRRR